MNRRTFVTIALSTLSTLSTLAAPAAALAAIDDGWKQLGTRIVDLGVERDTVPCGYSGFLKAIVIEVRKSPVEFLDVKVIFGNGEVADVPMKAVVRAGQRSRIIDLPGNKRVVNRVELLYRTARGRRAEVVVWGKE